MSDRGSFEAIYHDVIRLQLYIERILAPFEGDFTSHSELAKSHGITKVVHKTSMENLVRILSTMTLSSGKKSGARSNSLGDNTYVYLELATEIGNQGIKDLTRSQSYGREWDVYFVLDPQIINGRDDFHISTHWMYGKYEVDSASPSNLFRLKKFTSIDTGRRSSFLGRL